MRMLGQMVLYCAPERPGPVAVNYSQGAEPIEKRLVQEFVHLVNSLVGCAPDQIDLGIDARARFSNLKFRSPGRGGAQPGGSARLGWRRGLLHQFEVAQLFSKPKRADTDLCSIVADRFDNPC